MVDRPEPVVVADPDVVVEDEVGALAPQGVDRGDLHAGHLQRHQEHGEAPVAGGVGVGPGHQEAVLAVLGVGREHLLAGEHPLVAVAVDLVLTLARSDPVSGSV